MIDQNAKAAFEAAIKADPYDSTNRLVFADWLEENGLDDEGAEQRRRASNEWIEADKWLHEFAEGNKRDGDYYRSYMTRLDYEDLLELGREAIVDGDLSFSCGADEDICDALRSNNEWFWRTVSIITGLPLPNDVSDGWFSCGC